jgi:hypothetical protein
MIGNRGIRLIFGDQHGLQKVAGIVGLTETFEWLMHPWIFLPANLLTFWMISVIQDHFVLFSDAMRCRFNVSEQANRSNRDLTNKFYASISQNCDHTVRYIL